MSNDNSIVLSESVIDGARSQTCNFWQLWYTCFSSFVHSRVKSTTSIHHESSKAKRVNIKNRLESITGVSLVSYVRNSSTVCLIELSFNFKCSHHHQTSLPLHQLGRNFARRTRAAQQIEFRLRTEGSGFGCVYHSVQLLLTLSLILVTYNLTWHELKVELFSSM